MDYCLGEVCTCAEQKEWAWSHPVLFQLLADLQERGKSAMTAAGWWKLMHVSLLCISFCYSAANPKTLMHAEEAA